MKGRRWIAFSSVVIAYVVSRIAYAVTDFDYDVFSDPFDLGKLVVDVGVWVALYALGYSGLARIVGREEVQAKVPE